MHAEGECRRLRARKLAGLGFRIREECHESTHFGRPAISRNPLPIGCGRICATIKPTRANADRTSSIRRAGAASDLGGACPCACCLGYRRTNGAAARLAAFGRPENNTAAMKLAPVSPPPLATVADKITLDQLKAPKGFNLELYASGMPNARELALGSKGTVFVGSRLQDKVYAITDRNGKREAKDLVSGLYRPNGVAFKDGTLYIAELSQISKIENVEDKLDSS